MNYTSNIRLGGESPLSNFEDAARVRSALADAMKDLGEPGAAHGDLITLSDEALPDFLAATLGRLSGLDEETRSQLTRGLAQLVRIEAAADDSKLVPVAAQSMARRQPGQAGKRSPNSGFRYQIAMDVLVIAIAGVLGAVTGMGSGTGWLSGVISAESGLLVNILSTHFGQPAATTDNPFPPGMDVLQKLVFTLVQHGGSYSDADMTRLLRYDREEIREALAALEQRGLVRRQGQPGDGPAVWSAG